MFGVQRVDEHEADGIENIEISRLNRTDVEIPMRPADSPSKSMSDSEISEIDYTTKAQYYRPNRRILFQHAADDVMPPTHIILPKKKICFGQSIGTSDQRNRNMPEMHDQVIRLIDFHPDQYLLQRFQFKIAVAVFLILDLLTRSLILWSPDWLKSPDPHPSQNKSLYYFIITSVILGSFFTILMDWVQSFSLFGTAYFLDTVISLVWMQSGAQFALWLLQMITIVFGRQWYYKSSSHWLY